MKKLIPAVALVLGCASAVWAGTPTPLGTLRVAAALTNAEASRQLPVDFEATVIYYDRGTGGLNVQDGDVAIFVRTAKDAVLVPGDRVLVRGRTQPSFLPYVLSSSVRVMGRGTLPKPFPASFDDLIRPEINCRLVHVRGIVRTADIVQDPARSKGRLQLLMDGGYVDLNVERYDAGALKDLLDAEVEATGAAGRIFDSKMRQIGVKIKVSSLAGIKVLKRADSSPWSLPVTPLDEIFNAYHVHDLSHRIRVHGTITYYQPGTAVVLQNDAGSMWVSTGTNQPLQIGDVADATGFPDPENGHLELSHAEIRDSRVQAPIQPQPATWDQLAFWAGGAPGGHEYDLVTIEGRVMAEVRAATQDEYVLVSGGRLFTALYRHPLPPRPVPQMLEVPLGSRIRVTGICLMTGPTPVNNETPFEVVMRSFDDIAVVAKPSSLSNRNLTIVIGLLLVLVAAVGAWSWALERRIRRQTAALAYLEQRRSRILEDINSSRPLAEIIEQITEVVSFMLRGAPCWCQITDGARLGNYPPKLTSLRVVQQEIPARAGAAHGTIFAALHARAKPSTEESTALHTGARLATLAIETSRLYSDLVHRSEFDLLTDVQNRFSMERYLDSLIHEARQTAGVFGLIYIDLDELKKVNDEYGHKAGDTYLQEAARRMKRQLRPGDMLARLGGDEFAVLVPAVRKRSDVEEIAERLERSFDDPFLAGNHPLHGSASIGIALYPEDATTKDGLLSTADAAMYVTKHIKQRARQMVAGDTDPELTAGEQI